MQVCIDCSFLTSEARDERYFLFFPSWVLFDVNFPAPDQFVLSSPDLAVFGCWSCGSVSERSKLSYIGMHAHCCLQPAFSLPTIISRICFFGVVCVLLYVGSFTFSRGQFVTCDACDSSLSTSALSLLLSQSLENGVFGPLSSFSLPPLESL